MNESRDTSREKRLDRRIASWVLVEANRLLIAGGLVVGTFLVTISLLSAGLITAGPDSSAGTLLASGIVAGLLTLITLTLTINQLILSRVFGTPREFIERFEGTRDLREMVATHTDERHLPTTPKPFIALLGKLIQERAEILRDCPQCGDDAADAIGEYADDLDDYGERLTTIGDGDMTTPKVLSRILGGDYARHVAMTHKLGEEYGSRLPTDVRECLHGAAELLEALAVIRQYLKTISIQQELAELSRLIAYTGFVAFIVAVYLGLAYHSGFGVTLPTGVINIVVSVALAVIVSPLAVLIAYVLRVATIARYTTTVGPFVPPENRPAR